MNIDLTKNVSFILDTFFENGYSAYIVGGCVRDALLGKNPTDYDICTNALPNETKEIFSNFKIIETGIKHGTLTLMMDSVPYEITTFRTDGNYLDNRHPQSVNFVRNIEEDLKRRDFTINAMAYNKTDGLIDLFGGQDDLKEKTIRCVGDPVKRFSEDALRIMRAIRFSANLGFNIEEETKKTIFLLKEKLLNIASERINVEFTKTVLSDSITVYSQYKEIFGVFLNGSEKFDDSFGTNLVKLPKNLETRLAYLINSLNADVGVLEKLRYPSRTIKAVSDVVKNFDQKCESIKDFRLLISLSNHETAHRILTIKSGELKANEMLLNVKDLPCNISDLDICGDDLIKSGIEDGYMIGKILNRLLYIVIDENCENKKDNLLKKAQQIMEELK